MAAPDPEPTASQAAYELVGAWADNDRKAALGDASPAAVAGPVSRPLPTGRASVPRVQYAPRQCPVQLRLPLRQRPPVLDDRRLPRRLGGHRRHPPVLNHATSGERATQGRKNWQNGRDAAARYLRRPRFHLRYGALGQPPHERAPAPPAAVLTPPTCFSSTRRDRRCRPVRAPGGK